MKPRTPRSLFFPYTTLFRSNNAVFSNTGTFDFQDDNTIRLADASAAHFTNSGALLKTGGQGRTIIAVNFINTNKDTVQPTAGTLAIGVSTNSLAGSVGGSTT